MDNNANKSQDVTTTSTNNVVANQANVPVNNTEATNQPAQETPQVAAQVSETPANQNDNQAPKPTNAFNGEEKIIYQIKPEKDANPIGVIIFFAIIIGFAINLPTISKYLNKYITPSTPTAKTPTTDDNKKDDSQDESKEDKFYSFNLGYGSATIGNLSIKNPVMSQKNDHYELNFTLINDSDENYAFNKKYFIEFYDNETFISDSLIQSFDILPAKQSREFYVVISEKAYKKANQFKLIEKSQDDYPEKEITDTEGDYNLLKCTLDNDKITYYFKDNLLAKVENNYSIKKSNNNYQSLLEQDRKYAETLNNIDGVESTLVENNEGYSMTNVFVLNPTQIKEISDLKQYKLFRYNEKSKIVSYEITSLGYTCS